MHFQYIKQNAAYSTNLLQNKQQQTFYIWCETERKSEIYACCLMLPEC